jgi:FO synthase subunit 2
VPPRELRRWAREIGRTPAERTTTYKLRHVFADPEDDPVHPLDEAADHPERFGSYFELIQMDRFRFRPNAAPAAVEARG